MAAYPPARPVAPEGARARIQRALKLSPLFERASRGSRDAAAAAGELAGVPGGTRVGRRGARPEARGGSCRGGARAVVVVGGGGGGGGRVAADGRVVPLGYRGSGDILGESCLGHAPVHAENGIAMEELEYASIPLDVVDALLAEDAGLGPAALALLLARQRETEDRIESLLFRNVEGRLAEFLLKAADRSVVPTP